MLAVGERGRGCRRRSVEQGNPTAAGHGAGASGGAQSTVWRGAEQGKQPATGRRVGGGTRRWRAEQGLAAALRVGVGGGGEQGKPPAAGCGAGGGTRRRRAHQGLAKAQSRGRRRRRVGPAGGDAEQGPAGGDAEQGPAGGDMLDRVFFARFVWRKGEVKKRKKGYKIRR
jgi:hypothetical protein